MDYLGSWAPIGQFSVCLIALLATVCARDARAAACCVSATSFGVGRLLVWEDLAVGLQVGHARILGEWNATDQLRWNPSGYSEGISHAQLWAIMRLHTRAELQGWLPGLVNDRHLNGTRQIAGGIGDAGAAVRVQILTIGELAHLPSLAMTGGLFAPTGRRIEQTSPPLFAGATGRGAWGGSLAVESEYAFLPWFMRIEAGITTFLRFRRSDTGQRQQYGRLVRAALSAGREVFSTNLVAAVSAQAEWQARLALDDVSVNSSEVRLFALGVSLSWRATPHWTTVAVLTNSVWPDGFGRNQDARVDFTVGLRYGYF